MRKYTTEMFLTEDDVYDSESRQPPRFVTQIQSITSLEEMQATKFECQLAPVGDPNMKVEWFYNGKPLPFSKSTKPSYLKVGCNNVMFSLNHTNLAIPRDSLHSHLRLRLCGDELRLGLPRGLWRVHLQSNQSLWDRRDQGDHQMLRQDRNRVRVTASEGHDVHRQDPGDGIWLAACP